MKMLRKGTIVVFAALLLLAAVAAPAAGLGICEKALIACLMTPGHNTPWALVFCAQGYEFCKIYVLPLL